MRELAGRARIFTLSTLSRALMDGWSVDFGDGTSTAGDLNQGGCPANPSDPTAQRTPFTHTYTLPGTYTVHVRATSVGSCGTGPTQAAT